LQLLSRFALFMAFREGPLFWLVMRVCERHMRAKVKIWTTSSHRSEELAPSINTQQANTPTQISLSEGVGTQVLLLAQTTSQ
jgi:hypothetical protein